MKLNWILIALATIMIGLGVLPLPQPVAAASAGDVLIVEVGADPASAAGIGEPAGEFIEIFNNTASTINLSGWTLMDNSTTTITFPSLNLLSHQRLVVIADSTTFGATNGYGCSGTPFFFQPATWFSNQVSNAGDRVILKDNLGNTIDALSYGTDTTVFNPAAPDVFDNSGATLQRAGYPGPTFTDTNTASDFTASSGTGTPCDVPTAVKLVSFNATLYKDGRVLLEWRTGFEVSNLGFNVYREQAGRRTRITPQMIAGSALLVGAQTNLMSGRGYECLDSAQGGSDAQYWLEAIDLNGQSMWSGPFAIEQRLAREALPPRRGRSPLLSSLGRSGAQADSTKPVARVASAPPLADAAQQATAQFAVQSNLAARPAIKLSVNQEGWYRITQPELVAAGLDPKIDPRGFQLVAEGQEQPLAVRGEDDGRFDSSDSVEFYGLGLDTPSTDARAYWLVTGAQAGSRIKGAKGGGSRAAAASFPYTVERKDKTIYFSSLRNGEKENFFGAVIAGDPVDQDLFLQHVDKASGEDATLEVTLQGVTVPAHLVGIQINGRGLGEISFLSQGQGAAKYAVPHAALREGQNRITLTRRGGVSDVSLVDSIRLTYRHTYTADGNALRFTASSKQRVTIDGFGDASIRVMDVTDPNDAREARGQVEQRGGGHAITVSVPKGGQRVLLAFSDDWVKRPARIASDQPSGLRDKGRRADLVIITRREFFTSVEPLKQLRQSQGLVVAVVDIDEIYDEFNYGEKSATAVKDFLAYTKANWSKAPGFVLLVGDASFDARNYLGDEDADIVPTKLVDTILMETASDDWFADFKGDTLAEMAIGRLPVRTPYEATVMIDKIISYDPARTDGVVLISDSNDDGINFEGGSSRLRQLIPSRLSTGAVTRGQMSDAATRAMVLDNIRHGQKIINYFGHGSVDLWRGELLTTADAKEMANGDGLSILLSITCLNGYFQDPGTDGLAESMIKVERGGAVAVWASSGMCGADEQGVLNQAIFRLIFGEDTSHEVMTLGEATLKAKTFTNDTDIRQTYILFGDPTMRLR